MVKHKFSQLSRVRLKKIHNPNKNKKFGTVAVGTKNYKHGISKVESEWVKKIGFPETSKVIYGYGGKIIIVDGWNQATNTVGEFLGSNWHGDHRVLKENRNKPLWIGKTPDQLYNETIARFNFLYKLGFKILFVWELDYKKGFMGRYYRGPGDNLY